MISAFDIYLVGMCEPLNCVLGLSALIFSIFTFAALSAFIIEQVYMNEEVKAGYIKAIKYGIPISLIFSALFIVMPSSKTLAAMYVVPAIVNNEKVQAIGNNGLDILLEYTDEWVKDLKTSKHEEE